MLKVQHQSLDTVHVLSVTFANVCFRQDHSHCGCIIVLALVREIHTSSTVPHVQPYACLSRSLHEARQGNDCDDQLDDDGSGGKNEDGVGQSCLVCLIIWCFVIFEVCATLRPS